MKSKERPEVLQAKLIAIGKAVDDYFEGKPITSPCPNCGKFLEVTIIESVHSLWVVCPTGCTNYHASGVRRIRRTGNG
jgi:hypothetical protein